MRTPPTTYHAGIRITSDDAMLQESPGSTRSHNLNETQSRISTSHGDLSTLSYFSHETGITSVASSTQSKENNCNYSKDHCYQNQSREPNPLSSLSSEELSGRSSLVRSSTRHVFSDAEMTHAQATPLTLTKYFGHDINRFTNGHPGRPKFDKPLRSFIEPHMAKARKSREERRREILEKIGLDSHTIDSLSMASNAYVPYPALRSERPFLFDVETFPLHQILADTLGVSDLSRIHEHPIKDKRLLLCPMLDPKKRKAFHQCFDSFVNTFCIPLLHSIAMVEKMFNEFTRDKESEKICYRYQAFPCIRVIRPGEFSIGPHCDMAYGHSMGNINFHIPLTPTFGTNCMYTETHPGREDWHPLMTKSVGLGFAFDGARCLHFTLENTTQSTRVSLDFRIAIYRNKKSLTRNKIRSSNSMMRIMQMVDLKEETEAEGDECDVHDALCNQKMLEDNFSTAPGYYEESFVDLESHLTSGTLPGPVVQKRSRSLMHPDKRVGFPFK